MRLAVFLTAVLSTAWAQTNAERSARASQEQITYDDADGSNANWKYLAPQNQWRSQLVNAQRLQRAEDGSPHRFRQAQQAAPQYRAPAQQPQQPQKTQQLQPIPPQQFYKPYSAVPSHIKQLIETTYQPQAPYVNPSSFFYSSNYVSPQQHEQQPAPSASEIPRAAYLQPSTRYQIIDPERAQSRIEYSDRRVERQDRVVYKEDYEQQLQQQQQQQLQQQQQQQQQKQQNYQIATLPISTIPEPPVPTLYLDKNMPTEIKQLLQYQAQIPYDVTANRIQYKPKNVFIPKPLSDDVKGTYYYRSKVYYMNDDNVDAEYPQDKPVDEEQRH